MEEVKLSLKTVIGEGWFKGRPAVGCLTCGAVDSQAGWSLSEAEERVPQG